MRILLLLCAAVAAAPRAHRAGHAADVGAGASGAGGCVVSRLDDLQIARCEVVENAAILRGRIRDLNVQLKSTLPYSEYTRAADERAIFVDALQALERKAGELNREIRD